MDDSYQHNFSAPSIAAFEKVDIYLNASFMQNPSKVNLFNMIPSFLYLLKRFSFEEDSEDAFRSEYKSFESVFVPQPDEMSQDPSYDDLEPLFFCYLTTLIPKNHTASFIKYQRSKVKGLIRAAEPFSFVMESKNYIIHPGILEELRKFCDRHPKVLSNAMKLVLGFSDPRADSPVKIFAQESLSSIEYAYMLGGYLIEAQLVIPGHACLSNALVINHLKAHTRYKNMSTGKWGIIGWKYSALLDRDAYQDYKRSESFKFLYILAACVGSLNDDNYGKMKINKVRVKAYRAIEPFKTILNHYKGITETLTIQTARLGEEGTAQLRNRLIDWSRSDNRRQVPGSVEDDVSSVGHFSQATLGRLTR